MKDSKLMAFLKLVILLVVAGVMGYFIMQPATIEVNKKAKKVKKKRKIKKILFQYKSKK